MKKIELVLFKLFILIISINFIAFWLNIVIDFKLNSYYKIIGTTWFLIGLFFIIKIYNELRNEKKE